MNGVTVLPSSCTGTLTAPASKSAIQRAMALALLHKGETHISFAGNSSDEETSRNIIRSMGAVIQNMNGVEVINSSGKISLKTSLNFNESGLSCRMFTPIAALAENEVYLEGNGTLLKRPMHFFEEVLPGLNVDFLSNNGHLPFSVKGPLVPKSIHIDEAGSSQYLTGLLFAFAKVATQPVEISVDVLKSKPYISLSIEMLNHFGYSVQHEGFRKFMIQPGNHASCIIHYHAEGDWSGAAFLLVAAAIGGRVNVSNLKANSMQADRRIMEVLQFAGADVSIDGQQVLCSSNRLKAFVFDATDCPDLFPPLAALAANCEGKSCIKGCSRLLTKESNRVHSIMDVLSKVVIDAEIADDELWIMGGKIQAARLWSHQDHRIAMMAAVLALNADGAVEIDGAAVVRKSYPNFFYDLQSLGVKLKLHE